MARIPVYERQVKTAPIANVRRQAAETPASMGAGVGQAIAETGATLARAGTRAYLEIQLREREHASQVAHIGAMKQLTDWQLKRLHGPEGVLATRKGLTAQGLPEELETEFDQVADQIEGGLATEEQRARFQQAREGVRENVLLNAHKHAERELTEYDKTEFAGFVLNQKNLAAAQADDPVAVNQAIAAAVGRTQEYGSRNGAAPEAIAAQVASTRNDMWSAAITQALAGGNDQLARRYYEGAKDAGQLSGDALTRMTDAVKRGAADLAGERAAGEIWTEHGPKGADEAVDIARLSNLARERFQDDPNALKATLQALDRRKAEVEDSRRQQREATAGTLWRAVLDGRSIADIKRMPEYLTGRDEDVVRVVDYLKGEQQRREDRAYMVEGRELAKRDREEKAREDAGWYMRYQYDRPERLLAMTEDQILALMPDLGQRNATELLERRRQYQRDAELVRQATVDRTLFNQLAIDRGIDVNKVGKSEEEKNAVGNAMGEVQAAIARAQTSKGKSKLTYDETREVMESVLDRQVMLRNKYFFADDPSVRAATVVNPDDVSRAYVPIQQVPDAPENPVVETYLTWMRSEGLMTPDQAKQPRSELKTLFGPRLERAYALRLMGRSKAEILEALKGK